MKWQEHITVARKAILELEDEGHLDGSPNGFPVSIETLDKLDELTEKLQQRDSMKGKTDDGVK